MANPNEKTVNITVADLKELFAEIRKPVKTDREIREEQQAQLDREAMMKTLQQAEETRLSRIKTCSHMRPNGSTTAVYIADLNKLYCQACAGWIAPNEQPETFNKLYQLAI